MDRYGTLRTVDGRTVLRFERRLAHPVEKVWRAITEPGHLAHWFPTSIEGERAVGARLHFVFRNGEAPPSDGQVTQYDPPRVFAFTWDTELLHIELRPDGRGCLLIFTNTFDDRPVSASFASGWHACLDALESVALGDMPAEATPIQRRLTAESPVRIAELHEEYVERFGLGEGTCHETVDGWTVRFDRQLMQPLDAIWGTLTETDASKQGAAEPAVGGPPPLRFTNQYVPAGPVTAIDPRARIEYEWQYEDAPAGRVRWELSQDPTGSRIVLTQTLPRALQDQRSTALAAWHTHLELLAQHLRGQAVCWPEERTEELKQHYAGVLRSGVLR